MLRTASAAVLSLLALSFAPAASAGVITFKATLDGPSESPPSGSAGTGTAIVRFNTDKDTMRVLVTFTGLTGTTTASHIHCCLAIAFTGTAGVATTTPTFTGFPLGVTSGSYDHKFDMTLASSYNASFVTAQGGIANAEAALLANLGNGKTYLNVHSTFKPGGEIRGFLVRAPEPATLTVFGIGLLGMGMFRRRRPA